VMLPELLTDGAVLDALEQAGGKQANVKQASVKQAGI